MSTGVSTKQKLLCQLDEIDKILKDLSDKVNRKAKFDDIEHLVLVLLEKDKEYKATLKTISAQMETQIKIEKLRNDCSNSDVQIQACQKQLKKSELLLSTALYYCRQKLDAMSNATKNPTDVDELIKFSHRISSNYGALAPDSWMPGDTRRPYPNKEELRRGYLGHIDDSGKFLPSLRDAISQVHPSVTNTPSSMLATPAGAGATPGLMNTGPPSQLHNPASVPPGSNENASTYSPSIGLPGVNMVSSPGMPPSNGSAGQWSGPPSAQQQPRPSNPPSSLAAMLTGGVVNRALHSGPSESPSPQTPNRAWQQQQRYGANQQQQQQTMSQQQQALRKRQYPEDQRMYSDTSSDEEGGGPRMAGDFGHPHYPQQHHPGY